MILLGEQIKEPVWCACGKHFDPLTVIINERVRGWKLVIIQIQNLKRALK